MLRPLQEHPAARHPDLLVGFTGSDDAGVFRLSDGRALVQTVDFFTPIVDQPYDWGKIAAANALSDVYAMGGTPITALQLLSWPRDKLSFELAAETQRGGADVMAEAGCTIVGGHSIDSPEPTYGFAVTGTIDPSQVIRNSGAEVGDVLILTKPLGTGIISTAIKRGSCPPELEAKAIAVMTELNKAASLSMVEAGAHAGTDITGYGLLGHLREMLLASGVGARLGLSAVPVLDGVRQLCEQGFYPGGSVRNLDSVRPFVEGIFDETDLRVLADAQTSGGLLMSVPPEHAEKLGYPAVGEIVDRPGAIMLGS